MMIRYGGAIGGPGRDLGPMRGWGGNVPDGFGGPFGPLHFLVPLFAFLVVAAVVGLLVWYLVRARHGTGGRLTHWHAGAAGAERIVRERYARGEIAEDEYARMLDVLRGGPVATVPPAPVEAPTAPLG